MKHCEATVTVTVPIEVVLRIRGRGDPDDPEALTPDAWEIDDVVLVSSAPVPLDVAAALDGTHRASIASQIKTRLTASAPVKSGGRKKR